VSELQGASENVTFSVLSHRSWAFSVFGLERSLTEASGSLIQASEARIQADAAMTSVNWWFFIGTGFAIGSSLIGVGAVVYAIGKPKAQA